MNGMNMSMISPAQSRAGRALIDWSQGDLAKAAGVSLSTIADFERGRREPIANNLAAIRAALEQGGVTFQGDGEQADGGPGVRLQRRVDVGKAVEDLNASNDG